jgi:hypothetical protein
LKDFGKNMEDLRLDDSPVFLANTEGIVQVVARLSIGGLVGLFSINALIKI